MTKISGIKMKKYLIIISLFMMASVSISAQSKRKVKSNTYDILLKKMLNHQVPEITVDSLSKIENNVVLLDAREPDEYAVSHIAHATFVGYNNFNIDSLKNIDKTTPIVVYCSIGYRSGKITEKLLENGFVNVQNLYGGIFEWKNENKILVDEKGITNDIHPYSKTWGIWVKKGNKVYKK